MKYPLTNIFGWIGVLAILVGYGLLNFGALKADSLVYQILNIAGSTLIITETAYKRDFQPMVLNVVWLLIAAIALFRTL